MGILDAPTLGKGATGQRLNTYGLREAITPYLFGAVGDGVADDTTALQSWLNSTKADLFLPRGTYKITAPIIHRAGKSVQAERGSKVVVGATINAAPWQIGETTSSATVATEGYLRGLTIDCNNLGQDGIELVAYHKFEVSDTLVSNQNRRAYCVGRAGFTYTGGVVAGGAVLRYANSERNSTTACPAGSAGIYTVTPDNEFTDCSNIGDETGVYNVASGNRYCRMHPWGYAANNLKYSFIDEGLGTQWLQCEVDSPTVYGFWLKRAGSAIIGGSAYMNNLVPDGTAIAIYLDPSVSQPYFFVGGGFWVSSQTTANRWLADIDGTTIFNGAYGSDIIGAHSLSTAVINQRLNLNSMAGALRITRSDLNALCVRTNTGSQVFNVDTTAGGNAVTVKNGAVLAGYSDAAATNKTWNINSLKGAIRGNVMTTTARNDTGFTGSGLGAGDQVYDSTLKKPIWWDGGAWRDSAGTAV